MRKKNVIGILNKVIENSKDRLIKSECGIWIRRIEDGNIKSEIKKESELQKDATKGISIVYDICKENIIFDGLSYTYPEIKNIIIVRKFVELLMNK